MVLNSDTDDYDGNNKEYDDDRKYIDGMMMMLIMNFDDADEMIFAHRSERRMQIAASKDMCAPTLNSADCAASLLIRKQGHFDVLPRRPAPRVGAVLRLYVFVAALPQVEVLESPQKKKAPFPELSTVERFLHCGRQMLVHCRASLST